MAPSTSKISSSSVTLHASSALWTHSLWSIPEQTGDLMVTGPSALQQLQNGISSLTRSSHVAQSNHSKISLKLIYSHFISTDSSSQSFFHIINTVLVLPLQDQTESFGGYAIPTLTVSFYSQAFLMKSGVIKTRMHRNRSHIWLQDHMLRHATRQETTERYKTAGWCILR